MIKSKESILNFKNAANIISMCEDMWPLKIALFDYIINIYMEVTEKDVDDSDVGVLLRIIEILNKDYEDYLSDNVRETKL